jgi:hypothetical protein
MHPLPLVGGSAILQLPLETLEGSQETQVSEMLHELPQVLHEIIEQKVEFGSF